MDTPNGRKQQSNPVRMTIFHVPEDPKLLAAFGEFSLRHEHLSHILRMTIKTLADLEVSVGGARCDRIRGSGDPSRTHQEVGSSAVG